MLAAIVITGPYDAAGKENGTQMVVGPPWSDNGIGMTVTGTPDDARLTVTNGKARPVDIYIGDKCIGSVGSADTSIPSSITDTAVYLRQFLLGEYELLPGKSTHVPINMGQAEQVQIDCYGPFPLVVLSPTPAPVVAVLAGRLDDLRSLHQQGHLDRIVAPTAKALVFDIIIPTVRIAIGLNDDELVKLANSLYGPVADLVTDVLKDIATADGEEAGKNALINSAKILESLATLVVKEAAGIVGKEVAEELTGVFAFLGRADGFVELGRVGFDQVTAPIHTSFVLHRGGTVAVMLDVPYVTQGRTNWCAGAAVCMLRRYYGDDCHLWDISSDLKWTPKDGLTKLRLSVDGVKAYLSDKGFDVEWRNWRHLPPFRWSTDTADETLSWITAHLARRRPVIMLLSPGGETITDYPGHAVVAVGYDLGATDRFVYIHDPSGGLTDVLPSAIRLRLVPAVVRVDWNEFFEVRKGIWASWLGAVTNRQPKAQLVSVHLGRGRTPGNEAVSGFANVEIFCGEGRGEGQVGALKMDRGLRWRSTGTGDTAGTVDTDPPISWVIGPGGQLAFCGSMKDLNNVGLLDPRDGTADYRLTVELDGPSRQATSSATMSHEGGMTETSIFMPIDTLESGRYEVALVVEEAHGTKVDELYRVALPALSLDTAVSSEQPAGPPGMLDAVILIDKSGSMLDDIEAAKQQASEMLSEMDATANQQNISLQVGLVTFCTTSSGNVFEVQPLRSDLAAVRSAIQAIGTDDLGGDEDLYAALMYAMNESVGGKQIHMGWRAGAAKIALPITDEPPTEDTFTLDQVAGVAEALDPVHVYPLLTPKSGSSFLDPAVRALRRLADATDGQLVRVNDADELPRAIVDAMKLAIRRHKEELWRAENPPYLLYSVAAATGLAIIAACGIAIGRFMIKRNGALRAAAATPRPDPDLTGESTFRKRS